MKIKRLRTIYILYWFLLTYILAALVFWFIALNEQNVELSSYRLEMISPGDRNRNEKKSGIESEKKRKTTQYVGEGVTFFLLIVAGAFYVFRIINRQLYQSQEQQNFMMAVTHELKTPIAITKLNLETLQKRLLTEDQKQRLISTTIQEAERLNSLCNNLLLTSQIESAGYKMVKEKTDLSELVEECVHDFKTRYSFRKIETDLHEDAFIESDRMMLKLAINNLLDNALKYSGKQGIVSVKTINEKNYIKLLVADEGPGIRDQDKSRIFEKYFRGRGMQAKGTGLGLYITKRIVEAHDGTIQVLDRDSTGSIFEISFLN